MVPWLGHAALGAIAASLAISPSSVHAQTPDRAPLTLARGTLEIATDVEINMSVRQRWQPVSIAPDIRLGITDAATIGLVHSHRSQSRINTGAGLCLRGQDAGCARRYDNIGLDFAYMIGRRASVDAAARTRVMIRSFEPLKLAWTLGGVLRYSAGRLSVVTDPHIAFGLTSRDRGNDHFANIPIWLQTRVTRHSTGYVRTGIEGVLRGFTDTYRVPVGLGVACRLGAWDAGAELGMPRLFGPLNDLKPRHVRLFLARRWTTGIAATPR